MIIIVKGKWRKEREKERDDDDDYNDPICWLLTKKNDVDELTLVDDRESVSSSFWSILDRLWLNRVSVTVQGDDEYPENNWYERTDIIINNLLIVGDRKRIN